MTPFVEIACPYCGESFETAIDVSAGSGRYVEDCAVCCRPITVSVEVVDGEPSVRVARDDD
jgi:Cysteine-rich CPXCG